MNKGDWRARLTVVLVCGLAAGCNRGVDLGPFGDVYGQVTFRGQPVPEGAITFTCPETGQSATEPLGPDGTYRMGLGDREGLPVGEYQVYVRPPVLTMEERAAVHHQPAAAGRPAKTYPFLPLKYRSEETSGLTATVEEGNNVFDFDLGK